MSHLIVDTEKLNNGDWADAARMPGVRFKVRGLTCDAFVKCRDEQRGKMLRYRDPRELSPAEERRVFSDAVLETILLDWSGIEDDDGRPIAFSKELARRLFADPAYGRLFDAVIVAASQMGDPQLFQAIEDGSINAL